MSSVTTIIDMISYVLIAFVAISLVVSSIMIGVITYISVLERKKEIGILRAIGASKGDVSRVFNAETVIEGLVAGILGVGVTALVCAPISAIVYALFDVPNVAQAAPVAAGVLVVISVLLTFIARPHARVLGKPQGPGRGPAQRVMVYRAASSLAADAARGERLRRANPADQRWRCSSTSGFVSARPEWGLRSSAYAGEMKRSEVAGRPGPRRRMFLTLCHQPRSPPLRQAREPLE